ncbi:MAG: nucleotidyltransferase domain-containing protein [Steroidobacteraceae bacterium]
MTIARAALFRTVPDRDYLGFWAGANFQAEVLVEFLDFKKADIARITGVSLASVRFDHKMPGRVRDHLLALATLCALVAQHFSGDTVKTALWFKTANPLLAHLSPREMLRLGRFEKLRRFVLEATQEKTMSTDSHVLIRADDSGVKQQTATSLAIPPLILAHKQDIATLCRRYGVRQLALFGSILRADFDSASSDVDVVVEFGPTQRMSAARQYFDFKRDLEALLEHPVDLVDLAAMEEGRLKRIIERTQVPIYATAA